VNHAFAAAGTDPRLPRPKPPTRTLKEPRYARSASQAAAHKKFSDRSRKDQGSAELANKLIDGRIFDSGRGLVPFVSVEVFEKLTKVLEIEEATPAAPAAPPAKEGAAARQPTSTNPWAAIKVGSVVLVRDPTTGPDRGWWDCVVNEISDDGQFLTVRWKNYPKEKPFQVKRSAVAILRPKS
jgi:hypothetical protein